MARNQYDECCTEFCKSSSEYPRKEYKINFEELRTREKRKELTNKIMDKLQNTISTARSSNDNSTISTYTNPQTTGGTASSNTWPPRPKGETGWICPKCGRGIAPWKSYCDCSDTWTITCGPSVVTTPATVVPNTTGNPVPDWQTTTAAGTTAGTVTSRNGVYEYHGPAPDVTL